ncbi:hypothetical protein CDAR_427471 [Caerostris darwini]|uniref:Uncharacterized protein n=1 Tax=Caerostris darwini TaxID=1538125 RepID=A0AAV4ME17_9ARAC|nr:hypothetical protein CDAR_427471 [Caerostris darwini]
MPFDLAQRQRGRQGTFHTEREAIWGFHSHRLIKTLSRALYRAISSWDISFHSIDKCARVFGPLIWLSIFWLLFFRARYSDEEALSKLSSLEVSGIVD